MMTVQVGIVTVDNNDNQHFEIGISLSELMRTSLLGPGEHQAVQLTQAEGYGTCSMPHLLTS